MIRDRREEMDVYLTEQELLREEDLFAPHEESYTPLTGRAYDIDAFTQHVELDNEMPKPPPSC